MNEATFRRYLRGGLEAAGILTTHHEDLLNTGVPDISYSHLVHGWIELKYAEAWPKRASTPLRLPHYTKEQKAWLLRRGRAAGHCWLFLRVGRAEFLLFDHERAQHVGEMERGLVVACTKRRYLGGRIDFEDLIEVLTQ